MVIPARNEERALPGVLRALPGYVRRVVVTDNGSQDATARVARAAGAHVVHEPRPGYGRACLRALQELRADPPDVVVFLDADHSDRPQEMDRLLEALQDASADLVIGSRILGEREPGALTPPQRFGNALACALLRWGYGTRCTDLGPFRAIRWHALQRLRMCDPDYGWTVEMQIKAARLGLRSVEVPVSYRRRAGGESKVSGTVRGALGAGSKILWLLGRHAVLGALPPEAP